MHSVDLSKYDIRTDLVIEKVSSDMLNNHYEENGVGVDDIILLENNILGKKSGKYITISFNDVTDQNNYKNVLSVLKKEFSNMLYFTKIKDINMDLRSSVNLP